ncbi:hypothetical protein SEA_STELLA_50 [Streptomyces phage Stella]|nr:hypothetical protein SEA_STELLA_50 [Streptomyces phage Stella]
MPSPKKRTAAEKGAMAKRLAKKSVAKKAAVYKAIKKKGK